jgi:hypothetical protein
MANQHAHKGRYVRQVTDDDWNAFGKLCKAAGTNRSAEIGTYIRWALQRPDAPEELIRPEPLAPE